MSNQFSSVAEKTYANRGNVDVLRRVPDAASAILDIGCGAGDNARQLACPGRSIVGVTLSEDEAKLAREYCDRVLVANVEGGLPETMTEIDVAICCHVLEHICFPEKLLGDIAKSLSADGILIVALPNLMWYKTRFRLLMGSFEYAPHGIMDNTHFRWYTFVSAQKMLERNGFQIESAEAQGGLPLGPLRRVLPKALLATFDHMGCRLLPGLIGA